MPSFKKILPAARLNSGSNKYHEMSTTKSIGYPVVTGDSRHFMKISELFYPITVFFKVSFLLLMG